MSFISNADCGRLVWAKIAGSRAWPGVIVNHDDCGMKRPSLSSAWVFWFADNRVSPVPVRKIMDFAENFRSSFSNTQSGTYKTAVLECLQEFRQQCKLAVLDSKFSLVNWAVNDFPNAVNFEQNADIHLSPKVERCLCRIKKTLLRTASSSSSSQSDSVDSSNANERQNSKPKDLLLKAARDGKYDIETLCISCDQTDCEVVSPHPYIKGGTCGVCKEEFEDNKLACEEDGSNDMYCAVCGSLGEVLECDEPDCKRVFCTWCVELLVSPSAVQRIIETDPWHCFLCKPYHPDTHGLIQPRMNWQEKLAAKSGNHQSNSCNMILEDDVPDKSTFPNRPLRVLSLFDGIGTGFYALDKLGLEVEAYFASEINKSAMNVATLNFGTKITFIGDVQNFTNGQITEICPIDLLIGGSPCNDFSFVNPNRKGLFDSLRKNLSRLMQSTALLKDDQDISGATYQECADLSHQRWRKIKI